MTTIHTRPDTRGPLAAAAEGRLQVHYQPIVDASTRRPCGLEALLRWADEAGCLRPASEFIEQLERHPDAPALTRWVMTEACRTISGLGQDVGVSVNLPPDRLRDPALAGEVFAVLEQTGLDPARLTIEVVERAPMDAPGATRNLRLLRSLGTTIALDDFLVQYSSLGLLHTIPADAVKLDKSFVAPLNEGASSPLAEAVVHVARHLGLDVVAEGVETNEGSLAAQALGCRRLQGYLFGPAVSAEDLPRVLQELEERDPIRGARSPG